MPDPNRPPIGPAVLGIDPSLTATGIALIARSDTVARPALLTDIGWAGTDADTYDQRLDRIETLIAAILNTINTAIHDRGATLHGIAIEGPIYHGRVLPSYFDRAILFGALTSQLRRLHGRTPWVVINPATREKFITGVGTRGDKARVLHEMRTAWFPNQPEKIENHDQADALGLATAYAIHLGWPMPFPLRRCHVENVARITWPQPAA